MDEIPNFFVFVMLTTLFSRKGWYLISYDSVDFVFKVQL